MKLSIVAIDKPVRVLFKLSYNFNIFPYKLLNEINNGHLYNSLIEALIKF